MIMGGFIVRENREERPGPLITEHNYSIQYMSKKVTEAFYLK